MARLASAAVAVIGTIGFALSVCSHGSAAATVRVAPATTAAPVIATFTGTLASFSIDRSGVFGFAPGTDMVGRPFKLVFTIDPTKGTQGVDYLSTGVPYESCIENYTSCVPVKNTTNPLVAVVTINGHDLTIGTLPNRSPMQSTVRRVVVGNPVSDQLFFGLSQYLSPTGLANVSINCYSGAVPFTYDYHWQSPLTGACASGNSGQFNILYGKEYANGNLIPDEVVVSGQTPHIYFLNDANGQLLDVTNKTTQVVVGQRIKLSAVPSGSGETQPWDVSDFANRSALAELVGGYTATPCDSRPGHGPGCPLSGYVPTFPDITNPAATQFYWVVGQAYKVYYYYKRPDGTVGSSLAVFAVAPAPAPLWKVHTQALACKPSDEFLNARCDIYTGRLQDGNEHLLMGFGRAVCDPGKCYFGMAIGTNANPQSLPFGGAFSWVQVVQGDVTTVFNSKGVRIASATVAPNSLDGAFPYPPPSPSPSPELEKDLATYLGFSNLTSSAVDTPTIALDLCPNATKTSRSFTAEMFSMWKSAIPNSILVPQGSITWHFDETSLKVNNNNNQYSWTTPDINASAAQKANPGYPEWKNVNGSGPVPSKCSG